ncbi:NADPH-dependent 7-cyano-7-deazaguanine reductase QueF [bacterium]|nr:NADPH-dependent 7-cyano-7-deazaguanine reductase QueF [candidate division CSSED10-310 bacterium]
MNIKSDLLIGWDGPEKIRSDLLETFEYSGHQQIVTYTTKEFSAVCPFSGLPDIATVEIQYIPNRLCIELKSLKLYFVSFRNIGIFQEHVTDRIYTDLHALLQPQSLSVTTRYATRGGIDAVCEISTGTH